MSGSEKFSRLQQNPARIVPRRAFLLALLISGVAVAVGFFLDVDLLLILAGFWLGVVANLINFRLICISASKTANGQASGKKVSVGGGGYWARQGISALALGGGALLGIPAMIAAIIGLSMAKFAIQLDGFFTYKV